MRRGDAAAAERGARWALETAIATGEEPLGWRSGSLLGDALDALGREPEAAVARQDAGSRLGAMMAGIDDESRAVYATQPGGGSLPGADQPLPQA
jgi:hypothetical protein